MVLELWVATQSCVNREYSRGLSTQPWGAPVFRVRVEDVVLPIRTAWGLPVREVQDPVTEGAVEPEVGEGSVEEPTVVRVKEGSDAILPCLLRGENIELKLFDWRKKDDQTGVTKEVFMYEGGDHYNNGRSGQDEQFRGRVSHFEGEMKNGNASIIIRNPKVIDSGNYTCDFPLLKPQKTFNIQLVVGASPEPQLQWQDSDGNLVSVKELQVSERGGSNDVIVQATMTKTDTYQCVVTQKEINHQTQAETFVYISEGSCTNVVAGWSLGSFDLGAVALAAVQALIKSPICSTKGRNKGVKPECVSVSQQSLSSDLLSPADCSLKQRAGH
ncbi:hypothetical protein L3Q82_024418 [Scortum barcoo]|uniref:Uncharacterized protein n=1 Tax=Scortum barcoo TaxID=214431 RepID=A0ACB8WPE1_9TELE|nr:hypothetical protein L3Q82_024418 [Scortum barcoo]